MIRTSDGPIIIVCAKVDGWIIVSGFQRRGFMMDEGCGGHPDPFGLVIRKPFLALPKNNFKLFL